MHHNNTVNNDITSRSAYKSVHTRCTEQLQCHESRRFRVFQLIQIKSYTIQIQDSISWRNRTFLSDPKPANS